MLDKQTKSRSGLDVMVPMADKGKADALVSIMREQAEVMGNGEQREMLSFMRGVAFGRALGGVAQGGVNMAGEQLARERA